MSLDAATDSADTAPSDESVDRDGRAWAAEREAIKALVASALDKARPQPIARSTLALLIEGRLDAQGEAPGYRVVGRDGSLRQHPDTAAPLTLDDLIGELRHDHPNLFQPPEPEPEPAFEEPASATPIARPWAEPSARIRSLVTASRERGQALAAAGAGWMRSRLQARTASALESSSPGAIPGRAAASQQGTAASPWRRNLRRTGLRLRYGTAILATRGADRLHRWRDDARDAVGAGGVLRRPSLIAALLGVGILGLLTVLNSGNRPSTPPAPESAPARSQEAVQGAGQGSGQGLGQGSGQGVSPDPTPEAVQEPPSAPKAGSAEAQKSSRPTRPPQPPSDDEPAPDDAPMQSEAAPPAGAISGKAEVIDTATLKINGKVLRLFGVVWVRGGQTDELTRYLAGRPVTCQPVAGSDAHQCLVDGRDLSEVILFNGGGRASPEATPDLVAAEDRARTERLGVWAR